MSLNLVADQTRVAPPAGSRFNVLGNVARSLLRSRKALAGMLILLFFAAVALLAPALAPYPPQEDLFQQILPPSREHLLGTTGNGQDIFSQLVWGTRETLAIAIIAGLAAVAIAVIVGISAAYLGGLWDHVLNLFTDVFLVIPTLPLMIVIAAYARNRGLAVIVAAVVITSWSYGARQIRSQALALRSRDFLEAAKVRGERALYIILAEILPNMTSLIVASFLTGAVYAVLAAAGLQFIGLGDPNDLSWGTMLFWAKNNGAILAGSPLWAIVPGLCIAVLGGAFALLNYAFDEISNPALRPVRMKR
jgi:peptide/nickel transport system permease protein